MTNVIPVILPYPEISVIDKREKSLQKLAVMTEDEPLYKILKLSKEKEYGERIFLIFGYNNNISFAIISIVQRICGQNMVNFQARDRRGIST